VQLRGEQPPLRLLHLDQAPRRGLEPLGVAVQVLLGALALGDVVDDLREAAQLPVSSSSGVRITCAQNWVPFLRTRQPSLSYLPWMDANWSWIPGSPRVA